ncbi:MAG TPA: prolyl-tRNA synthetase, partial [candidate division WWE3 bacterium]|nr:prolyl-tRNA synthetase [candidate division WWE3 bacterium]
YLPLGLKVIEKIKAIVREEMNSIEGQEIITTSLQPKNRWEITNRWDDEAVDIWFKTKLKDETEVGLAWSHEEAIIDLMKQQICSYKDLPISVYQFQTKLRNELRAKSGIMRGREFLMKDMYSMCQDSKQHDAFYNSVIEAYKRVFDRTGIGKDTYITFASGGAFTDFSHEFQTLCENGEDTIYLHKDKKIAVNKEVYNESTLNKVGLLKEELVEVTSSEVGNIFDFRISKSKETNFYFINEKGEKQFVHLGSYGIGITRLMGVIVEKFADNKGLSWPKNIAPFKVHLVGLNMEKSEVAKGAEKTYEDLVKVGIETFFDDRLESSPGEKLQDSDLLGMPFRVIVSEKTGDSVEYKGRKDEKPKIITIEEAIKKLG